MGEVFRARDRKLNRDVAIKVLPAAFAKDAERVARFRREAQVLASLNHSNIAAIYELEELDGVVALALELVEGEDLAERLKAEGAETLNDFTNHSQMVHGIGHSPSRAIDPRQRACEVAQAPDGGPLPAKIPR